MREIIQRKISCGHQSGCTLLCCSLANPINGLLWCILTWTIYNTASPSSSSLAQWLTTTVVRSSSSSSSSAQLSNRFFYKLCDWPITAAEVVRCNCILLATCPVFSSSSSSFNSYQERNFYCCLSCNWKLNFDNLIIGYARFAPS